ncbi:low molecular weight protein-tyrosine-phosphatase [Usitatibacter palustris]|uniref:protein-tyrosine-phosphatase n=1 Tax=Usitatibacter palustris TaxID=2732487 RepID=A0A6M4H9Z8_9PROT|nr:low molecular weight protein-tyrosine-phosphatase [Usitatibacter palustris]QJR15224.1 Putative low molecular weight protein-tyrosine-phosphatase [Usitatibacter palustris]
MRSILVVCTGNICRSPTAEGVLRAKAKERGLAVRVASAGTLDYHVGEPPDRRSMAHATQRGYDLSAQRAQQVTRAHFQEYDYILAMDRSHLHQLEAMAPANARAKLAMFLETSATWKGEDVPDPYYGGAAGFEQVLDMIEEAAEGWLDQIEGSDPSIVDRNPR